MRIDRLARSAGIPGRCVFSTLSYLATKLQHFGVMDANDIRSSNLAVLLVMAVIPILLFMLVLLALSWFVKG